MELDEEQKNPETEDMPVSSPGRGDMMVDKRDIITQSNDKEIRQQAHEHLTSGCWSQAAENFLELLDLDAQDEDALQGIAAAFDGMGRYEALLDTAQCLLGINPNSAIGLASKARALQKLERISEAMIANDQALLLDTNLPLAWINRSGLQILQQKFPEALRSSQRAIELAPGDARAWANRGVALLNLNRLPEALESFERSLAQNPNPNHLFALQMKGEILAKLGRMSEAIATTNEALAIDPKNVFVLSQATQALRSMELYTPLKEVTSELVKLTPDSLFAWEHYMRALRGLGQYVEANEALDHVLELDPSNVSFWTMKADTLYRLERYREAVVMAERAVRLNHGYPPARRIHEKSLKMMYQKKKKKKE